MAEFYNRDRRRASSGARFGPTIGQGCGAPSAKKDAWRMIARRFPNSAILIRHSSLRSQAISYYA
jgi:hypothetical protein